MMTNEGFNFMNPGEMVLVLGCDHGSHIEKI